MSSKRWTKRNEALDERLVGEMRKQLARLQDRHRELEARHFDDDGLVRRPVGDHVSRYMRDRHVASLRALLQRNMDSIEREIQDTIRRLGTALTVDEQQDVRSTTTTTTSSSSYPDLIPTLPTPRAVPSDADEADDAASLPSPGNPDRQFVLGAVKEILDKRKVEQQSHVAEEQVADVEGVVKATTTTNRIGFYEFTYSEPPPTEKLNRLSVQKLPSVTIATPQKRNRSVVVSVQSPSVTAAVLPPEPVEPFEPGPQERATSPSSEPSVNDAHAPAVRIDPDDVACVVSEILAGQLDLALGAFCALPTDAGRKSTEQRAVQTDAWRTGDTAAEVRDSADDHDDDDDDGDGGGEIPFPLTIDTCTQTMPRATLADAFTVPEERPSMVDRASGPLQFARLVDRSVQSDADVTHLPDEPLTPPRCALRLAPDASLPDVDALRRRYPASPPPSRSPSPCRESAIAQMAPNSSSSASDAARISTTSSSSSSNNKSSETRATNSTSADVVSWLSEGEVPNRVASPGLAASHSSVTSTDRSFAFSVLSEGQVLVPLDRFNSTPLDVSSLGEVPPPRFYVQTPRSESTDSFQSATGSPGELCVAEQFSTADDVTNQLESE